MNIDETLLNQLVETVYKRVEEKFSKKLNEANVEFFKVGVVTGMPRTDASGNTTHANVTIEDTTTGNILNKSGESLNNGDRVKVFFENNNMKNAYIGVKF